MAEASGVERTPPPRQRHTLVTIAPQAWARALAGHEQAHLPLLRNWAARGWPAIIRRPTPADPPGLLPIGVPLPPAEGKLRIALAIPPEDVLSAENLPALATAAATAPASWQHRIAALLALGQTYQLTPRVFGSLCWQARTGLPYLSPGSDLDIIWPVTAQTDLAALAEDIMKTDQLPGPPLDGELVLPDGRAVNMREFCTALRTGGQVLVKDAQGASLTPLTSLRATACPA